MRKIKNSRINKVFYPTIIFVFVLISFIGSIYQLNLHYDGHHHGKEQKEFKRPIEGPLIAAGAGF